MVTDTPINNPTQTPSSTSMPTGTALTDEPTAATMEPTTPQSTSSDRCEGAAFIDFGESIAASTLNSTLDPKGIEDCGTAKGGNRTAPGSWYQVTRIPRRGKPIMITVNATYDVQLFVFQGNSCDSLTCQDGSEGISPTFNVAYVTLESVTDDDVYILVTGFQSAVGEFDLSVSDPIQVANDVCDDAIKLELEEPLAASSIYATSELDQRSCNQFNSSSKSLWYSVKGTGNPLQAELSENNFGAHISNGISSARLGRAPEQGRRWWITRGRSLAMF